MLEKVAKGWTASVVRSRPEIDAAFCNALRITLEQRGGDRCPRSFGAVAGGKLPDPMPELHDGNGNPIAFNDDWQTDSNHSQIPTSISSTYDTKDSALYRVLAPGAYSAVVTGNGSGTGSTGVALVEFFDLSN